MEEKELNNNFEDTGGVLLTSGSSSTNRSFNNDNSYIFGDGDPAFDADTSFAFDNEANNAEKIQV